MIFSGRELDYANQLNLPRVLVDPLDEGRIAAFLERHAAEGLAGPLAGPGSPLRELARNPLNLFVLVMVYLQGDRNVQTLANRGRLFQSFTLSLLQREQLFHPDRLGVEAKVTLLAKLAYEMQRQGAGTTLGFEAACQALPATAACGDEARPVDPAAVFRFGRGASILDPATWPEVRFYHHVLQEYFAARELLRRCEAGEAGAQWWCAPRLAAEMPAAQVGEWDPLPEPPATGWEVTTLLACGLSRDPGRLVEAVRGENPALAGRCLVEAGVTVGGAAADGVRGDLLAELTNPAVHRRARLQAGFVLGRVGDPRFTPQTIGGVRVILPAMVDVPAGRYPVGSSADEPGAYDDEKPRHTVELAGFGIARWPLTNAEYACFMEAGGYTEERWWATAAARRWLQGEDPAGGQMQTWLNNWKILQTLPDVRRSLEETGNFTPEQVDVFEEIARMTEAELKETIARDLARKSRRGPQYWDDPRYNNPSQPVVGITWFEAGAYCAWLSAVAGREYRLPSEVEWEAAARGEEARVYPWGADWDPERANTLEGRVLKPSPVGAFSAAGGVGPFGAEDQAGNVWEWTSSLFLSYPYHRAQSEDASREGERVLRGGSWGSSRSSARCAYRLGDVPDVFNDVVGFRLVSPGIFLDSAC